MTTFQTIDSPRKCIYAHKIVCNLKRQPLSRYRDRVRGPFRETADAKRYNFWCTWEFFSRCISDIKSMRVPTKGENQNIWQIDLMASKGERKIFSYYVALKLIQYTYTPNSFWLKRMVNSFRKPDECFLAFVYESQKLKYFFFPRQ